MSRAKPAAEKATRKLGGNPGAKTKKIDGTKVTTSAQQRNSNPPRKIIRCQDGVLLYEVVRRPLAKSYEVVSPDGQCWSFSLRYQAECKFERVAARGRARSNQ